MPVILTERGQIRVLVPRGINTLPHTKYRLISSRARDFMTICNIHRIGAGAGAIRGGAGRFVSRPKNRSKNVHKLHLFYQASFFCAEIFSPKVPKVVKVVKVPK